MENTDTKLRQSAKVASKRMNSVYVDDLIKPVITIRQLDAQGKEVGRQIASNTLTYAALDILVNSLLRSGPAQVSHLYARFGDSGANPGYLAPDDSNLRNTTRTTFLETSDGVRGGLWVPIMTAPMQDSSDPTLYQGNRATFFFRLPSNIATSQISPDENFDVSSSFIYALGLAVAFNTGDRAQDKIMAAMQAYGYDTNPGLGNFTRFQIPPGGQTAIDYTIPIKFKT